MNAVLANCFVAGISDWTAKQKASYIFCKKFDAFAIYDCRISANSNNLIQRKSSECEVNLFTRLKQAVMQVYRRSRTQQKRRQCFS